MPTDPATFLSRLPGKFLAFEGADGSGKTTQLRRFVALCQERGLLVCEVREPGGTPVGEKIRSVLLDKENAGMTLPCEMLLYMASRAQLVESAIRPALALGKVVVADRFVTSTYAYQGAAGGLPEAHIDAVTTVACGGTLPHLVMIFDVDEATAAKRSGVESATRRPDTGSGSLFADRMEDKGREFQRRVREGYLAHAKRFPGTHAVIDARGGPDDVWERLLATLARRV